MTAKYYIEKYPGLIQKAAIYVVCYLGQYVKTCT